LCKISYHSRTSFFQNNYSNCKKITQNEKRLNAFHSNQPNRSIKIQYSMYSKVYFLTIFAYTFVFLFKVPQLIHVRNSYVFFRLLNLSGVPLKWIVIRWIITLIVFSISYSKKTRNNYVWKLLASVTYMIRYYLYLYSR
jgi:hypothetical protein